MKNSGTMLSIIITLFVLIVGGVVFLWIGPATPSGSPIPISGGTSTTTETYRNAVLHYSIAYPLDFAVNETHVYQELGPNKDIHGVSFTIPSSMAKGTNLSSGTYLAVESLATSTCSAASFLSDLATSTKDVVDGGVVYNFGLASGAGAGNFYEEYVYALKTSNPCIAVRYFIHSTNIGNYPPGTVTAFDKGTLLGTFDGIRRSLAFTK